MITKIVLENFMAHELTELELGPGVNALTGPNNTGKSAIVEGLRCLATNPVPKHYIRHGAKEARVSLEFEDGTRVVWVRKKRSSGYELWKPGAEEPEEYWKFGRKPPEDILNALRLDLVELETGGEIDVHVGNQREPVFLLNQPGSNAAAFFAASTESAHLLAMQNLLKRQTLDAKRQEKDLKGRLVEIEGEMDLYSPLPGLQLELEEAKQLESTATRLRNEIPAVEKTIAARVELAHSLVQHTERAQVLENVSDVPKLHDVSRLSRIFAELKRVDASLNTARNYAAHLSGLTTVPEVDDTQSLSLVCSHIQALEMALESARTTHAVTVTLADPPLLQNTPYLSGFIDDLLASSYRLKREARREVVLQTIVEPPVLIDCTHLESLLFEMVSMAQQKQGVESAFQALETELESLQKTIEERVETIGCCPTCGADINTTTFLDRGCSHDA